MYGSFQPEFLKRTMTHYASCGVQLSVRYAAEVATAASVVFGAVPDGSKRVQENLQRVKGRTDHQLLSVREKKVEGENKEGLVFCICVSMLLS